MAQYVVPVRNMTTDEVRAVEVEARSPRDAQGLAIQHAFRQLGWQRSESVILDVVEQEEESA